MRFDWLHKGASLEELVATVSEGFCPRCKGRLTQQSLFSDLDPELEGAFARGGCPVCKHWMVAGHGGSNPERDWFSVTMCSNTEGDLEGARLTMSLNPPKDDDEYEDDDWDEEERFEDY